MKTRSIGYAASVIGFGAIAFSTACADQPKPKCVTGRGEFAARYTYVSGPESCKARKGAVLGVQSYNLPLDGTGTPDLNRIPVAIQDVTVLEQASAAEYTLASNEKAYSFGIFEEGEPDQDGICYLTMSQAAQVKLPAAPATSVPEENKDDLTAFATPGFPERSLRYDWNDVQFYVTSSATGTQFQASLRLKTNDEVCEYDVRAVYPSVSCGKLDVTDPEHRRTTADPVRCTSKATQELDLLYGNPVGSSINPDFSVSCQQVQPVVVHGSQPTEYLCLPSKPKEPGFPSLRKTQED